MDGPEAIPISIAWIVKWASSQSSTGRHIASMTGSSPGA